jgi:hypothetical protein
MQPKHPNMIKPYASKKLSEMSLTSICAYILMQTNKIAIEFQVGKNILLTIVILELVVIAIYTRDMKSITMLAEVNIN